MRVQKATSLEKQREMNLVKDKGEHSPTLKKAALVSIIFCFLLVGG